jgi:hypothetical protein
MIGGGLEGCTVLTNAVPSTTVLPGASAHQLDADGAGHWVVVVKGTYLIDDAGRTKLAKEQEPVCLAAEYLGEDGLSSLLREVETNYVHPGTDVLLNATAYGPGGQPTREMRATVAVGPLRKELIVVGDRQWKEGVSGLVATSPVPFQSMPICYERAYGGVAPDGIDFDPRNPIGAGYAGNELPLDQALPNIENPTARVKSPRDQPPLAGFGAIAGHWTPRRELAGTYDETWRRSQAPLYPHDLRPEFFCCSSEALHSPAPLVGGERIQLEGLSPSGMISCSVPREAIAVDTWIGSGRHTQTPQLDRVILEPDDKRIILVWRASVPCGARVREVKRSRVTYKRRAFT